VAAREDQLEPLVGKLLVVVGSHCLGNLEEARLGL